MRRKDKLYTVTKGNRDIYNGLLFEQEGNKYALGDWLNKQTAALGNVWGANKLSPTASGLIGALGNVVGNIGGSLISDGMQTGVGSAVSSIGSIAGNALSTVNPLLGTAVNTVTGLAGGVINRGWGVKENTENVNAIKENTATARTTGNQLGGASTNEELLKKAGMMTSGSGFTAGDLYKNGWFTSKGTRKGNDLINKENAALAFQTHGLVTGAGNADSLLDDGVMGRFAADGGPLGFGPGALGLMQQDKYLASIDRRSNAIAGKNMNNVLSAYTGGARTLAGGGSLEADFLDNFSSNPIGAVVRYNQGLEQLAAEREAAQIQAAKEAELNAMQNRLMSLETANQGLEALLAAQPTTLPEVAATVAEAPESSPSPSPAVLPKKSVNSNWDYIEQQLRNSGKFNDTQIRGIKYNLQRESSIDPTAVGDGGKAFGLGQWHGSRQPKDRSLEGQTKHLIETLSNFDGKEHWIGRGNYEGFMNARTPEEAHYYLAKGYERPASFITDKLRREMNASLRAFGGELGTNGTDWTSGLLHVNAGGRHEDNPLEGVPMGVDPEGVPNLVEEGETVWNDYVFSDRLKVPKEMVNSLGLGGRLNKEMSFAEASKKLSKESEQRPNDPISLAGLEAAMSKLAEVQEAERMKNQMREYVGLAGYACGGKMGKKYDTGGNKSSRNPYGDKKEEDVVLDDNMTSLNLDGLRNIKPLSIAPQPNLGIQVSKPLEDELKSWDAVAKERWLRNNTEEENYYPTWMRYAPVIGSGAMALTDLLGITNRPDYTMANKIEAAAERAGYAPNVEYTPIGDYLRYNPMDIWYEQNRLNANSRAADRAILNSGANQGSKIAGVLANNYNNQIASGDLYRKALEYNDAKRQAVADFNRRTNMFNSQMGLEAAMANARYGQQAAQMGLSGLAQAAAMRDAIDARVGASRTANLSNFLTSLGNIGRENFALNQINSDKSSRYGARANGTSYYKATGRANGGKIQRKK